MYSSLKLQVPNLAITFVYWSREHLIVILFIHPSICVHAHTRTRTHTHTHTESDDAFEDAGNSSPEEDELGEHWNPDCEFWE